MQGNSINNKNKAQIFQVKSGQCLLLLQKIKLRLNMIGCNAADDELNKFCEYYQLKSKRRLDFIAQKLQKLMKSFQLNAVFLNGIQLKGVNNMLSIYRKNIAIVNQQLAQITSKVQKHETDLTNLIISDQPAQTTQLQTLFQKLKKSELQVFQKCGTKNKNIKSNLNKVLNIINKSEAKYFRYYQKFQRSITTMISQIHEHMQTLNQFYTVWENLGSSLIYQLKSDKQVFIEKSFQQKHQLQKTSIKPNQQTDQDSIMQIINAMPENSKTRSIYEQKLKNIHKRHKQMASCNNTSSSFNNANLAKFNNRGNIKTKQKVINKVQWFETESQDIRQSCKKQNILLKQKEDGYFRYTYEQLHKETHDLLKGRGNLEIQSMLPKDNTKERFINFVKNIANSKNNEYQSVRDVPIKMQSSCWFDRVGSRSLFQIQDCWRNIYQRKLQYYYDRQVQMQKLNAKKKQQCRNKQQNLNFLQYQMHNLGFKQIDHDLQLKKVRAFLSNKYNSEFLPKPQKKYEMENDQKDFSQEDEPQIKDKVKQISNNQFGKVQQTNMHSHQLRLKSFELEEAYSKQKKNHCNNHNKKILVETKYLANNQYLQDKPKQMNKKQLEYFIELYIPQIQKIIINRSQSVYKEVGISENQLEIVCYKYLKSTQFKDISQCLNLNSKHRVQKAKKEGLNKFYLINQQFYITIQQLFFRTGDCKIKIQISLIAQLEQFNQLKTNLEMLLSFLGTCVFKYDFSFIQLNAKYQHKFYGMMGTILRKVKFDKRVKNTNNPDLTDNQLNKLIQEGQKVYSTFLTYYKQLALIQ